MKSKREPSQKQLTNDSNKKIQKPDETIYANEEMEENGVITW